MIDAFKAIRYRGFACSFVKILSISQYAEVELTACRHREVNAVAATVCRGGYFLISPSQSPNAVPLSGRERDVSDIFVWGWGVKGLLTI
jgi:hypothetical protein